MNDKDMKKLSRLEILELLLEQTKINEKLNKKVEQLNKEKKSVINTKIIDVLSEKMDSVLEKANTVECKLSELSEKQDCFADVVKDVVFEHEKYPTVENEDTQEVYYHPNVNVYQEDELIYCKIIHFYAEKENSSKPLPTEIVTEVRERLRSILNERE